ETGFSVEPGMRGWYGVYHHRPSPKAFGFEPHPTELIPMGLHCIELLVRQFERERKEESLGRGTYATQLSQNHLIEDPLMSRMLVDNDDPVGALVEDVTVEHLKQGRLEAGPCLACAINRLAGNLRLKQLSHV